MSKELTIEDVMKLAESFLNETRPDNETIKRVEMTINLAPLPFLSYIYEAGIKAAKSRGC